MGGAARTWRAPASSQAGLHNTALRMRHTQHGMIVASGSSGYRLHLRINST